jgi:hypothetical protein
MVCPNFGWKFNRLEKFSELEVDFILSFKNSGELLMIQDELKHIFVLRNSLPNFS